MRKYWIGVSLLSFLISLSTGCSDSEKSFTKLDDLENATIGAMIGSTGEQLAKNRFPDAHVKSFDDIMDAIIAIKSNRLDAVITSFTTAMNVCKRNPDLTTLSEPVAYENTSIAVAKENGKLLAAVDEIITELRNDGTLQNMQGRWFRTDLLPYEIVDIPLSETGEILKIGTSATREPFCFIDENRNVTGHDGELALRIGAKLGRPVEFFDMKFAALISALQSRKIDMIVAGMTATEERSKSVDFSQSYFKNSQVILVKRIAANTVQDPGANDALQMKVLDDIADKSVGVYAGTIHDTFVEDNYPGADIHRFNSPADIILSLKMGKIDAAFMDLVSSRVMLKSNPEIGILSEDALTLPVAVGFNYNNPELRSRFNDYLKEIKTDGTYDSMIQRWFVDDPETAVMPEFEFDKNAPEITLAVSVGDLPNSAVVNGKHVGFDVELVEGFAARKGYNLKISIIEFPSLIAALSSGKADIIADGMAVTAERQKRVAFSDSYNMFKTAVLVLNKNLYQAEATEPAEQESSQEASIVKNTVFRNIAESFHSNIIQENRYLLIIDGLKTTVLISILATLFGTLLGGIICFMRMSRNKILLLISKIYISILRGTPVLVVLMIIFYVVFASVDIDPVLVAVIAFGLNFAAYVSEMFRTGIEGVDRGQTEAGIAIGFTRVKTFIYIVLPQAVRRILPVYKGEMISLVKMTSIVGYIAVQDLTKASDIIRSRTFDAFFPLIMVAVLYFLISWLLMFLLGYIERKRNPKPTTNRV